MAKGVKTGGRKKGTPNKKTLKVIEILEELNYDPLREAIEMLRKPNVTMAEAISAYREYVRLCDEEGIDPEGRRDFVEDLTKGNLFGKDRLDAHIKLIKYVYPARKAIEISSEDEKKAPVFTINFANKGE